MDARTIRKYGNRRLYDTTDKRYVNLDEIAGMIREGAEIKVVDAKTGEDLTRSILTQIIVEETKSRNGGLPLEILRELVALSDRAKHAGLVWYLRSALETYRRAQHMPVEFMRNLFVRCPPSGGGRGDLGIAPARGGVGAAAFGEPEGTGKPLSRRPGDQSAAATNCSSSVDPASAAVEARPPAMTLVMSSK
jgi:polyhydroxyalkanoate synthesis repressor PhaR